MFGPSPVIRFSTSELPERERLTAFREVFGRAATNLDMTLLDGKAHADGLLRVLPGASVMWAHHSGFHFEGPYDPAVAGNDFVMVWTNSPGVIIGTHVGREFVIGDGAATLFSCADRFSGGNTGEIQHMTVKLQRSLFLPLVRDPEAVLARQIPTGSDAFRLLKQYLGILRANLEPKSAQLEHKMATHIADLVALAIGTARDETEIASNRGLRAARLDGAKRLILENLCDQNFSVADVALAQGVTPRYVQMLFEGEGTTFSSYLLERRLAWAHRRLTDPSQVDHQIGAIALDAGFGDLSYFNRVFRRTYGETPSDVRYRALRVDPQGCSRPVR
jgi:AraC-like DNA-binding protein